MKRTLELLEAMGIGETAFAGRIALVTGAARGIGAALAEVLAMRGATVALLDVRNDGEDVARRIREQGGDARFVACDLAIGGAVERAIDEVEATVGPVGILVNNAVAVHFDTVWDTPPDVWDHVLNTNVRAPFLAMRRVLPQMRAAKRGVVANLVSLDGSPPFASAFNASKHALRSLTLTAAREIGPDSGVAIFAVLPGVVDTPGLHDNMVPGFLRTWGGTKAEALAALSQNPGYDGLMPAGDCAAALAALLLGAQGLHGQVADPFAPLSRHGLLPNATPAAKAIPLPTHLQTVSEVIAQNRDLEQKIALRTRELAEAHARSEELLLNVLPAPIAARLLAREGIIADHFDDVTVLFADLVGFTRLSAEMPPQALVRLLDETFSMFDDVAKANGLEKIKTVGDCYMLAGGIPSPCADHTERVATAALTLLRSLAEVSARAGLALECRIGMHRGPVVAGVIGKHKFIYDLWGDTVNTASRMESHGVVGAVHCTEAVRTRLADRFAFDARGDIDVKGLGRMSTFLLRADVIGHPSDDLPTRAVERSS